MDEQEPAAMKIARLYCKNHLAIVGEGTPAIEIVTFSDRVRFRDGELRRDLSKMDSI